MLRRHECGVRPIRVDEADTVESVERASFSHAKLAPNREILRLYSLLVVDDDRDAADSLATLLRFNGHDCAVAYDGRTAIDEVKRGGTDAVVLDIEMPGLTGYETASFLLNSQAESRPILIALTALTSLEARATAMQTGFDGFLSKPADVHRLMSLVAKLSMDRRAYGDRVRASPVLAQRY